MTEMRPAARSSSAIDVFNPSRRHSDDLDELLSKSYLWFVFVDRATDFAYLLTEDNAAVLVVEFVAIRIGAREFELALPLEHVLTITLIDYVSENPDAPLDGCGRDKLRLNAGHYALPTKIVIGFRPQLMESSQRSFQKSTTLPRTTLPVSWARYTLWFHRITDPSGITRGSTAATPRRGWVPVAV